MSSYEPPQGQAAAYQLGKLDAQLQAEREARARADQTNAYLLELLAEQRASPASKDLSASSIVRDKANAESVQQLLDASEQRIEELKLELKLEKLKAENQNGKNYNGGAHKMRAEPPNMVPGRAVHACPADMEATLLAERAIASRTAYNPSESSPVGAHHEKMTQAKRQDFSKATDIPTAEWMYPVKEDKPKPEHAAKMHFKSYFVPSSATPAQATHPTEDVAKSNAETQAGTYQVHAPLPPRSISATEYQDGTTRFGRFERDCPRTPRSHGRPPPNPRPFHPGHFPHQPWPPRDPPQLPPRPPFAGGKLISYADLDQPVEPPLPLHEQPSSGYLGFDEDLYDEPSSSKVNNNNNETITKAATPHQLLPKSHGLKQSIHAQSLHWPVFKTALHNHRHVDVTKILSADSIPSLLETCSKSYFILCVTPPKKTVRVISPTEVETSYALTIEFARGDAAAEFVRSIEDVSLKVQGCGDGFKATQRRDLPSPLLPRELGEAVWRRGVSRTLIIEEPGAALRVPANLRYQIEHCPYTTGRRDGEKGRGGSAGECGGRLQGPPEFLHDGSIRLVFWDFRDAVVAYRTWTMSPLFRKAEVSHERDGMLPELEQDGEREREEEEDDEQDSGVEKEDTVQVVRGCDEKGDEEAKRSKSDGKHIETRAAATSDPLSVEIEIEKEEDDGYAAGNSEDMENSIILSPKCISPKEEESSDKLPQRHPNTNPRHRIGVCHSPNESDVDVEEPTTVSAVNHNDILNYDSASDDIEEGEVREPLTAQMEDPLTCGALPPRQKARTSTSTLPFDGFPRGRLKSPPSYDQEPERAERGNREEFNGMATSRSERASLEAKDKLMGRSRWAAVS